MSFEIVNTGMVDMESIDWCVSSLFVVLKGGLCNVWEGVSSRSVQIGVCLQQFTALAIFVDEVESIREGYVRVLFIHDNPHFVDVNYICR